MKEFEKLCKFPVSLAWGRCLKLKENHFLHGACKEIFDKICWMLLLGAKFRTMPIGKIPLRLFGAFHQRYSQVPFTSFREALQIQRSKLLPC